MQNSGVVVFGENSNMVVTHTKFINNGPFATVIYGSSSDLVIDHGTFTNNSGYAMDTI